MRSACDTDASSEGDAVARTCAVALAPSPPSHALKATTRHDVRVRAAAAAAAAMAMTTTATTAAAAAAAPEGGKDTRDVRPSTAQMQRCRVAGVHSAHTYATVARELSTRAVVLDAVVCTHRCVDDVSAAAIETTTCPAADTPTTDDGVSDATAVDVAADGDTVATALARLDRQLSTLRATRCAARACQGNDNDDCTSEAAMQARLRARRACEQDRTLRRIHAVTAALTQQASELRRVFAASTHRNGDVDDGGCSATDNNENNNNDSYCNIDDDSDARARRALRARAAQLLCEPQHWLQTRAVALEEQQAWRALLRCAFAQRACVHCIDDEAAQRRALVCDEDAQRAAWRPCP